MKSGRVLVIVAAVLLLTSCSSTAVQKKSGEEEAFAAAVGSAELQTALADGTVTYDEYAAGYQRYFTCMEAGGYPPVSQTETNRVITYSVPAAAVDSGLDKTCYDDEFGQLDETWQISQEDTGSTAHIVTACLIENNLDPAGTLDEMLEQLEEAKIGLDECLALDAE